MPQEENIRDDVTDSPATMPSLLRFCIPPSLHLAPCPQFFPPSPTGIADIIIGITDLHHNTMNTFFSHMTYSSTYSLCVFLVLFVIISATSLNKFLPYLECAVN